MLHSLIQIDHTPDLMVSGVRGPLQDTTHDWTLSYFHIAVRSGCSQTNKVKDSISKNCWQFSAILCVLKRPGVEQRCFTRHRRTDRKEHYKSLLRVNGVLSGRVALFSASAQTAFYGRAIVEAADTDKQHNPHK